MSLDNPDVHCTLESMETLFMLQNYPFRLNQLIQISADKTLQLEFLKKCCLFCLRTSKISRKKEFDICTIHNIESGINLVDLKKKPSLLNITG